MRRIKKIIFADHNQPLTPHKFQRVVDTTQAEKGWEITYDPVLRMIDLVIPGFPDTVTIPVEHVNTLVWAEEASVQARSTKRATG